MQSYFNIRVVHAVYGLGLSMPFMVSGCPCCLWSRVVHTVYGLGLSMLFMVLGCPCCLWSWVVHAVYALGLSTTFVLGLGDAYKYHTEELKKTMMLNLLLVV